MTLMNQLATGTVVHEGVTHPAEPIAGGAAYELFSDHPADGFRHISVPHRWAYHRFVPAAEVTVNGDTPAGGSAAESALMAPLSRGLTWSAVHRMSQRPARDRHTAELLATIRGTATIRRGTRMIKPLSAADLASTLRGQLPHGFCYREWDVAHLRTPADLSLLGGADSDAEVAYVLRWRAVDPADYRVPVGDQVAGLLDMPTNDRVGPPVLGTGFAPSGGELIPEWITADFADLPLPAHATLVAYTTDGTEVVLYSYQAEQRGWLRLVGPQWRHLLNGVPDVSADQDYVAVGRDNSPYSTLVGTFRGEEFAAVADPPDEFRVLAMTRAARYPVETLVRRQRYTSWRGLPGTVLAADAAWVRIRLCRPDPAAVAAVRAQCYSRGVYETWAPATEISGIRTVDLPYRL